MFLKVRVSSIIVVLAIADYRRLAGLALTRHPALLHMKQRLTTADQVGHLARPGI